MEEQYTTHEVSESEGGTEPAAEEMGEVREVFLGTADMFHEHGSDIAKASEVVQKRAKGFAGVCVLAAALAAGCASAPRGVSGDAGEQAERLPTGAVASAVLKEVLPKNASEVAQYTVEEGLRTAAVVGGFVGVAALEALSAAKIHHNAVCAERAHNALEAAVEAGGGTVRHEGSEVRGVFSVTLPPKESWEEVLQGMPIDSWNPQYRHDANIPAWLEGVQAVASPLSTLAERAYDDEARETDAFFSYVKEFGVGHAAGMYDGQSVVVEVRYKAPLPVEVSPYVGGAE